MKKLLAVLLAVLMLGSVMAAGAGALSAKDLKAPQFPANEWIKSVSQGFKSQALTSEEDEILWEALDPMVAEKQVRYYYEDESSAFPGEWAMLFHSWQIAFLLDVLQNEEELLPGKDWAMYGDAWDQIAWEFVLEDDVYASLLAGTLEDCVDEYVEKNDALIYAFALEFFGEPSIQTALPKAYTMTQNYAKLIKIEQEALDFFGLFEDDDLNPVLERFGTLMNELVVELGLGVSWDGLTMYELLNSPSFDEYLEGYEDVLNTIKAEFGDEPLLKWWEKLPAWVQWLLKWICFGWIWM